jgi:hypothetical protein
VLRSGAVSKNIGSKGCVDHMLIVTFVNAMDSRFILEVGLGGGGATLV